MKRFLGITMIFMMLFSLFPAAMFAADNTIEGTEQTVKFTIGQKGYSVGSTRVATDVAPYIKDGRTMVPVAFVAPALGTDKAVWLPESQTVSITRGTDLILIKIGSKELIVNGKILLMDTAAEMKSVGNGGGRTMLPIAFIAKALEIGYQWDGATSSVNFFGYSKTYDTKGTYGPETGTLTIEGNVVVKADGVILKNLMVKGNLIIAKEVGDGNVTLDNITVRGETFIRGGGIHSIRITGNSHLQNITIARVDGEIRVYAEDGTQIGEVTVDGSDDVIIEGNFGTVTIASSDVTVTATNADILQATIKGDRSTLLVNGPSTIATARIDGENARVVTETGTRVDNIIANGSGASISGTGTVGTVDANANDIHVTTTGTEVTAGTGTTGIMAGSVTVGAGGSEIVGGQTGSGGGGSGGGGGDSHGSNTDPEVTNISLAANAGLQVGNANVAANAEIGTLSTTGGTAAFSYELVADGVTPANSADNASFAIAANKLKVAAGAALAVAKDYKVTVKVTDSKSKTYTKGFTVTVAAAIPAQSGSPAFTAGTPATYNSQLTVGVGTLGTTTGLTYTWYRSADNSVGGDTSLTTGTTYTPVAADIGNYLIVVATSTNATGTGYVATAAVVAKAAGPAAPTESITGTFPAAATSINLAALAASATGLEAAVAIDGSSYAAYADLTVDGSGNATISGLTGVTTSTKVKIRVKATATNLAGTDKEITVTAAIPAQSGSPAFTAGTPATYNSQLTVGVGTLGTTTGLTYTWYRSADNSVGGDTSLTTGTTYTPVAADIGNYLIVVATSTNATGTGYVATAAVVAKAAGPAAPTESITGTFPAAATSINLAALAASATGLEAAVAIDGSSYAAYADLTVDGSGNATISGLTGVTTSTKVKIRVKATATNLAGTDKEITVTAAIPAQSGSPAFTAGTPATYNSQLTVGVGTLGTTTGLTYTWYRSADSSVGGDTLLTTGTTYTPVADDIGQYLIVVATSTNATGTGYVATAAVVAKAAGPAAPTESITGTFPAAATSINLAALAASVTGLEAAVAIDGSSYAAYADLTVDGSGNATISGLTGVTTSTKVKIRVKATATNLAGTDKTITVTAAIPAQSGSPAFTAGTPATYNTQLTVGVGTLGTTTGLTYTWYRSFDNSVGGDTSLTTGTTYTPVAADIGNYLIVVATSTNATGTGYVATAAVVAKAAGPAAPTESITGTFPAAATSINLAALAASATGLEAAVAIDGSSYATYADLTVDGSGNATISGLTGVTTSTKVKIRVKATATNLAGTDKEITVTAAIPAQSGSPAFTAGTPATYNSQLTVGVGTLGTTTGLTYTWYRSFDNSVGGDTSLTTGTTYTPVAADIGRYIIVVATSTDATGTGYVVTPAVVAQAAGPAAPTESITATTPAAATSINLAGLAASATGLEAAVAINGSSYGAYVNLTVDGSGNATISGLAGVTNSTKVKIRVKATSTNLAGADKEITVTIPVLVSGANIYASGNAIIIDKVSVAYSDLSNIYLDKNNNGTYESGTDQIVDLGSLGLTATNGGYDLSGYSIYGGVQFQAHTGDSNITMLGGKVTNIYGGGNNAAFTGDTHITVSGGNVTGYIYGGIKNNAKLTGSTHITVSGGNVGGRLYGGGAAGEITGSTNVTVSGGNLTGDIFGGGEDVAGIKGSTNVTVSGGTVSKIYGGGFNDVGQNTNVIVSGGNVTGDIFGGGCGGETIHGSANVTVSGGNVTGKIYGGGYDINIEQGANITISGGTILGEVIGGRIAGNFVGTKKIKISGGSIIGAVSDYTEGKLTTGDGTTLVYKTTLTLSGIDSVIDVSDDLDRGGVASGYGLDDVKTTAEGVLVFYLPTGVATADYGSDNYRVTVAAIDTNAFVKVIKYAITLGTITRVGGDSDSTITIDASPAVAGATVTLTAVPKAGMRLKAGTLKANYNDGAAKEAALSGAGPYTFTMPAYAVSVTAEFEAIPVQTAAPEITSIPLNNSDFQSVYGNATAGATIRVYLDSVLVRTVTANETTGYWSTTGTGGLDLRTYGGKTVYATAQAAGCEVSESSNSVVINTL